MLTILKHHEERVRKFFPGITDPEAAITVAREQWIPDLKQLRWHDGSIVYPNLDEKILEERFMRLIVAVNTGDYETIPEWTGGRRNKDFICEACGNLVPSVFPDGIMCGALKKAAELSRKYNPEPKLGCDFHQKTHFHPENKKNYSSLNHNEFKYLKHECRKITPELNFSKEHCGQLRNTHSFGKER